jgi:hypothetical protein
MEKLKHIDILVYFLCNLYSKHKKIIKSMQI